MAKPSENDHLIVFGRYPRVGEVKTRLIPALGPAGAAVLQKRLTEKTMATARKTAVQRMARLVFCHEGGSEQQIRKWLGSKGLCLAAQAGGNLGRRLQLSMKSAFDEGACKVVLIGTDIPGITTTILNAAFDALNNHDLVLGPSTDGGYWLVGLSKPENIFTGIAWSTADVTSQTLALARKNKLTPHLLDPLADLDTPEDLAWGMDHRHTAAPYLSIIIPTMNAEKRIARTIAAAATPDTEIIVSDGGSKDRTVEIAQSHAVRVVAGQRGCAGQLNRGASAAGGEVVLFLKAGTLLPEKYVGHLFETLMDRRTALGAFRFGTRSRTPTMRWLAFVANLRASWLHLPYGDQGLFLKKDDFKSVGGFPETTIAEDLFFVRKMARRGRIALAAAAAIPSGRRWEQRGLMRTTLIDTIIAVGCLAGVSPSRMALWYRLPAKK